MTRKPFDGVEVETAPAVELAVIWLHGLGADGHDFEPLVPELALPCATRFVFPHAPVRPVTINAGLRMRAWYDILGFDRSAHEDGEGLERSAGFLGELIDREQGRGLEPERIVVAGFSQGGAVALYTGVHERRQLGGVVALSAYLPLARRIERIRTEVPVFMAHGLDDPVIDVRLAERSRDRLRAEGVDVAWHLYPMGHSVCAAEVRDLGLWLRRFA